MGLVRSWSGRATCLMPAKEARQVLAQKFKSISKRFLWTWEARPRLVLSGGCTPREGHSWKRTHSPSSALEVYSIEKHNHLPMTEEEAYTTGGITTSKRCVRIADRTLSSQCFSSTDVRPYRDSTSQVLQKHGEKKKVKKDRADSICFDGKSCGEQPSIMPVERWRTSPVWGLHTEEHKWVQTSHTQRLFHIQTTVLILCYKRSSWIRICSRHEMCPYARNSVTK